MLTFPNIAEPVLAESDGNSFKEDFPDHTISSVSESGYKITRPRTTRTPGVWSYSWIGLSDNDYALLIAFWKQVTTAEMFLWTEPKSGVQKIVRFGNKSPWQWFYHGWRGSLTFEEV